MADTQDNVRQTLNSKYNREISEISGTPETQLKDSVDSRASSMAQSPHMFDSKPQSSTSLDSMPESPGSDATPIQTLLSASTLDRILPPLTPSQNINEEVIRLQNALLHSRLEND